MKNILLLILVAWFTNAFAQNEKSISFKPIASIDFPGHIYPALDELETSELGVEYDFRNQISGSQALKAPPIQSFDSILFWKWDEILYDWALNSRQVDYEADDHNNRLSYKVQLWDGLNWKDDFRLRFNYDLKDNLVYHETMKWSGSAWINYTNTSYTYDDSSNIVKYLSQSWNGADWINTDLVTYVYNAKNKLELLTVQSWNGISWNNVNQYSHTYDTNNNAVTTVTRKGVGELWENLTFNNSTYDEKNNRITDSIQEWNWNVWVNSRKYQNTYDSGNKLLSRYGQSWDGLGWFESSLLTQNYDVDSNLIRLSFNVWDNGEWILAFQNRYSYDDENFETGASFLRFNADGTTLIGGDSIHFYFSILSATDSPAATDKLFSVYPNPSTGKFTIHHANAETVEVFNVKGKRVYGATLEKDQVSFQIDLGQSAPGIYFIKLQEGRQTYCHKIVVQ